MIRIAHHRKFASFFNIMYAIVNISGKQYKAEKGAKLSVPKQHLDEGKKLVLEDVLMVHDGKSSKFGNPNVTGAKVTATVLDHGRERVE